LVKGREEVTAGRETIENTGVEGNPLSQVQTQHARKRGKTEGATYMERSRNARNQRWGKKNQFMLKGESNTSGTGTGAEGLARRDN